MQGLSNATTSRRRLNDGVTSEGSYMHDSVDEDFAREKGGAAKCPARFLFNSNPALCKAVRV
jgi:hypothetical protein